MIHRYLIKYVILILFLIICAGAALYFTETSADSHEDAVLALLVSPNVQADTGILGTEEGLILTEPAEWKETEVL